MKVNINIKISGTDKVITEIGEIDIIKLAERGIKDMIYDYGKSISEITIEDVMKKLKRRFQIICYSYIQYDKISSNDCIDNIGRIWSFISDELKNEIKKQLIN